MTTGRFFLLVGLLWLGLVPVLAAAPPAPSVPSLQRQLAATPADTSRVLLLNALCWQLGTQNTVLALAYGQQGLRLARQLHFGLGEVYLLNSLARAAYLQHDELAAISYYQQAVRRAEAKTEPRTARQLTLALLGLGRVAVGQQDFAEGEKYFRLALSRMQQHKHAVTPIDLGMVQNHLASLYYDWRRSGRQAPDSLSRLGTHYARQALATFRRLPPDDKLAACLNSLGEVHALAGRYDSAAVCQREALGLYQRSGNAYGLIQTRLSLATVHLAQQRPAEAARLLRPALAAAQQLHATGLAAQCYQQLAEAQAAQGQGLEAYRLARAGQALLDSVQSDERRQALARLQVQFDAERQRSQLKELTHRNLLQQVEAHRQRQYLLLASGLLLAVAAGLVVSGTLAWRLRRSQAQLTHQNEELTATRAEQDRLYALVAHDLRSPVVAFTGLANLMTRYIERQDTTRLAGLGDRVRQAAEGLRGLLDNLLSWALVQRGELVPVIEPVAVADLLREVALLYQPSAEAADVHVAIDPAATGYVLADRNMTSTILRNLLSNAMRATPPSGQVTLSATAASSGEVSLRVSDTGAGMDAAHLRRAQGLAASMPAPGRRGATGLGLRLSRAFAQAQHGQLMLKSQPGQGTTAELVLPAAPVPARVFLPQPAVSAALQ